MTLHHPEPPPKPPKHMRLNDSDTALALARAAVLRARYTSYWVVYKKAPPFV